MTTLSQEGLMRGVAWLMLQSPEEIEGERMEMLSGRSWKEGHPAAGRLNITEVVAQ